MDAGLIFVGYELGWDGLDDDKIISYVDRFGEYADVHEEDTPEIAVIYSRQEEVDWQLPAPDNEGYRRKVRRLRKYYVGIGIEMFWEDSVQIDSPGMIERISLARDILLQTLGNEFQGEPGIYVKGPI
tara:strand:- start:107 stop:490 length:384 start_codon:yes stop_codon:yes gene_type:complete